MQLHTTVKQVMIILPMVLFLTGIGSAQQMVDLNTAGVSDLDSLPGVTERMARKIIEYRETNGFFNTVDDVVKVKGIGKKTLSKLRPFATIGGSGGGSGSGSGAPAPKFTAEEILSKFKHEPTVADIQKAALEHARIFPEEIKKWQRGVHLQALIPETRFRVDYYTRENSTYRISQNIDFRDEPDRYIIGPDEYSIYNYDYEYLKYSVQLNWDFDELIFNREELRVRDEAEDLIDFKTKFIKDVTKLYFERRRLQIYLLLNPNLGSSMEVEKTLRMEELTSLLDMMTGGYLTDYIKENKTSSN